MSAPHELAAEDLSPSELFWHAKDGIDMLAYASQIQRDAFAQEMFTICDEQCYAAIELGDAESFKRYRRAAYFIFKVINKHLHGADFNQI